MITGIRDVTDLLAMGPLGVYRYREWVHIRAYSRRISELGVGTYLRQDHNKLYTSEGVDTFIATSNGTQYAR